MNESETTLKRTFCCAFRSKLIQLDFFKHELTSFNCHVPFLRFNFFRKFMTLPSPSRREFIIRVSSVSAVVSAGAVLSACGGGGEQVQFAYGVASGDPLSDRVILWTHAKYAGNTGDVALTYEVATDNAFTRASVVTSGLVIATSSTSFTAKVDATGLEAGKTYFYRFTANGATSPVGKTRTLPASTATEVKFAVFSCANYPDGYFHVYGEAIKSDAEYSIHLGDYIYEHANATPAVAGRAHEPNREIGSVPSTALDDYRTRHAQYKSDPNLKVLHASMPMIAVWDDHESANDGNKDGADAHQAATEGSWADRKKAAIQAWHEWMPVRAGTDMSQIYRSFNFGSVLSLHMLDSRLIGRDKQVTFTELLTPATAGAAQATLFSPTRQILGSDQQTWLLQKIGASTATWQVLGQQVLMGRMEFPLSALQALNTPSSDAAAVSTALQSITAYIVAKNTPAASRTSAQAALMNTTTNPKLGYNLDAWDGYPVAREVLLAAVLQANKKLVSLAGDTHNAWHSDLTLKGLISPAQADIKVGEEFATPAVSSNGLEYYFPTLTPAQIKQTFEGVVDDLNWMDPSRRGYLKMTFTKTQAKGEWVFVNSVKSTTYSVETPTVTETRTYTL